MDVKESDVVHVQPFGQLKGTVQPFESWFLRRISALLIEKS
jgi:hypothetical protein